MLASGEKDTRCHISNPLCLSCCIANCIAGGEQCGGGRVGASTQQNQDDSGGCWQAACLDHVQGWAVAGSMSTSSATTTGPFCTEAPCDAVSPGHCQCSNCPATGFELHSHPTLFCPLVGNGDHKKASGCIVRYITTKHQQHCVPQRRTREDKLISFSLRLVCSATELMVCINRLTACYVLCLSVLQFATEAALTILRIDDLIKLDPPQEDPEE